MKPQSQITRRPMKNLKMNLFSSLSMVMALAACTKELPYQYTLKEDVQEKSAVDTNSEYIYSASMLNASMSSQDALPFSFSDSKRVKLEWTKDALRIIEAERDARFQANKTNNKLVLEIPVEYVDYQCAKDKFGECSNSEEERRDISWDQKGKFKFKLEAAKSGDLTLLPILIDKTLGDNCYEEVTSRVVGLNLEKDAVNMQIERTFKTNINCLQSEKLSDATVSAVYQYSLVKASAVLSPNFQTVSYPELDQNTFGFFATERSVLDTDNNATVNSKKVIMNHWSPNREKIDYFLSPEFSKPENSMIRSLTFKTVENINKGLKQSGAKFQIVLHDAENKIPGDIRNSMIVLVEDPVASSVIGYGPQTEDPVTGEIISARTIMFLGTIKKYIKYTYDEILRDKKRLEKEAAAGSGNSSGSQGNVAGKLSQLTLSPELANKAKAASLNASVFDKNISLGKNSAPNKGQSGKGKNISGSGSSSGSSSGIAFIGNTKKMVADIKNYTKSTNDEFSARDLKAQYAYLKTAKNCEFSMADNLLAKEASAGLLAKFSANDKPWDSLSESAKQRVIDIILPEIWIPTLIHEMGHNLGLRHNFQGSEDKNNFFADSELQEMGIDHEIPFSTVMEYGDDLKALPVMGKYDIAALRFAYAQQVETADGKIIPVVDSLDSMSKAKAKENSSLELKDFGFCTDEHTGINAGCRRFDLGTSYTEIVQNEIKSYMENYKRRNFRDGRASMSLFDDPTYAGGIKSRLMGLRTMQEVYERIKNNNNGLSDDNPVWDSNPFLKDLKTASYISAQFLMSIVTTPDLTCVVVKEANPKQIVALLPISQLSPDAISCFNADLAPGYKVLGQYGKLLNSKKDPDSDNHYADQIDVRGIWIDKLIATKALFQRQLGVSTFDKYTDSFADRQDIVQNMAEMTYSLMMNKVTAEPIMETADGSLLQLPELPIDLNSTSLIDKAIHPAIARAMGIPNESVYLSKLINDSIATNMTAGIEHKLSGQPFANLVKVNHFHVTDSLQVPADAMSLLLGTELFIASPANAIAFDAISSHRAINILEQVAPERIKIILEAKAKNADAPADLSDEEKAAWDLATEQIQAFSDHALESPGFYELLLNNLAN